MEEKKKNIGKSLVTPYKRDLCEVCGRCLMKCPVMRLKESDAIKEMTALRAGKKSQWVLNRCETCMACNIECPNGANPSMLFLERFHDYHNEKGYPAWSMYYHPHNTPNFRTYVLDRLPEEEKRLLSFWADLTSCKEFAYPGCNLCTAPYLTRYSFLSDLNIRGGLQYCCGEMYFRTGMFDELKKTARKMNLYFERLGAEKMMVLCTAGYNLFTNILPQYGLETDMKITSYLPWLYEKIKSGNITVTHPLNISVTIQDSCHAKIFGPEYYELPRKILNLLGAEVKEMKRTKDCALCCGIGGGFPAKKMYHPAGITGGILRAISEAEKTGSDAIVTYCAGCMQSISSGMAVLPVKKPVYHIFEAIGLATGEKRFANGVERSAMMLKGTLLNQTPKLLGGKRVKSIEIDSEIK